MKEEKQSSQPFIFYPVQSDSYSYRGYIYCCLILSMFIATVKIYFDVYFFFK